MSIFSNPIVTCGLIALGIILILIAAVVICCKKSSDKEREELKMLSEEIEADFQDEEITTISNEDNIEDVLMKMQEALEVQEENPSSFEQEQEENAIISYQELLNSLGANSSINLDAIELFDDELENQVEISDFNKEIIEAYQNENLDREIYRFQNDYSSQPLQMEFVNDEVNPVMDFRVTEENTDFIDNSVDSDLSYVDDNIVGNVVYDYKTNVVNNTNKKFKKTEFISPVYGIIEEPAKVSKTVPEDIEEIVFDDIDDNSLFDEF